MTETTNTAAPPTLRTRSNAHPHPTTLADIRDLPTVPVWHATKPNAAGVLGISKELAYRMAREREIPAIHLHSRMVVPVPALRRLLGDLAPLPAVDQGAAG